MSKNTPGRPEDTTEGRRPDAPSPADTVRPEGWAAELRQKRPIMPSSDDKPATNDVGADLAETFAAWGAAPSGGDEGEGGNTRTAPHNQTGGADTEIPAGPADADADGVADLAELFGVDEGPSGGDAGWQETPIAPRERVTNNLQPRPTPPPPPVTREDAARRQREAQLRYYEEVASQQSNLDDVRQELMRAGIVTEEDEAEAQTAEAVINEQRMQLFSDYLDKVREALQGKNIRFELTTDPDVDARQRARLDDIVRSVAVEGWVGGVADQAWFENLVHDLYDELIGLGPIAPLWRDPTVTEIMVNSWNDIWVERSGRLYQTKVRFRSEEHAINVAKRLAEVVSDRALNYTQPLVTAVLPNSRVAIGFGTIVGETLAIAIRKFAKILSIDQLIGFGALTEEMKEFLSDAVVGRTNIIVSGGTGSGKTTLINNLSSFVPHNERIITIEDAYELDLQHPHVVRFQTKEKASADDQVSITTSDLLRHSLRMRPDRIIVGEVRDGDAAVTLLEAANTGHDGTMTTVHANSAEAATTRLIDLFRRSSGAPSDVAAAEVSSAFELVVHVARRSIGSETRRFVTEIAEIVGYDHGTSTVTLRPLYVGEFKRTEDGRGDTEFRHVGGLLPEGRVADKMSQVGIDPTRWIEQ